MKAIVNDIAYRHRAILRQHCRIIGKAFIRDQQLESVIGEVIPLFLFAFLVEIWFTCLEEMQYIIVYNDRLQAGNLPELLQLWQGVLGCGNIDMQIPLGDNPFLQFALPIQPQTGGAHDEDPVDSGIKIQQAAHLNRFANTHFIGQ